MPRVLSVGRLLIRQVAGAIVLNGSSQYIDLGNTGPISTVTGSFTLAAWFRRTILTGTITVVGDRGSGALKRFTINFNSAYRATPSLTTSGGQPSATILAPYPLRQWEHQAIRYNGSTVDTMRHGALESTTAKTGTVTAPTGNMAIGSGNGGVRFWGGSICEVRLWGRALTDEECMNTYQGRDDAAIRSGLIGEWLLYADPNDTVGTNNGTAVASPSYTTTDVPVVLRPLASGRVPTTGRILIT